MKGNLYNDLLLDELQRAIKEFENCHPESDDGYRNYLLENISSCVEAISKRNNEYVITFAINALKNIKYSDDEQRAKINDIKNMLDNLRTQRDSIRDSSGTNKQESGEKNFLVKNNEIDESAIAEKYDKTKDLIDNKPGLLSILFNFFSRFFGVGNKKNDLAETESHKDHVSKSKTEFKEFDGVTDKKDNFFWEQHFNGKSVRNKVTEKNQDEEKNHFSINERNLYEI